MYICMEHCSWNNAKETFGFDGITILTGPHSPVSLCLKKKNACILYLVNRALKKCL